MGNQLQGEVEELKHELSRMSSELLYQRSSLEARSLSAAAEEYLALVTTSRNEVPCHVKEERDPDKSSDYNLLSGSLLGVKRIDGSESVSGKDPAAKRVKTFEPE